MTGMPADIVAALLPSLSDKDKDKLRELLAVPPPAPVSACVTHGHKFKPTGKPEAKKGWFGTWTEVTLYCERCGEFRTHTP